MIIRGQEKFLPEQHKGKGIPRDKKSSNNTEGETKENCGPWAIDISIDLL